MTQQTRWQCADCHREWLYATNWNETNCPTCGSPHVSRVTYSAVFPGADIGTRSEDIPREVPELPPTPAIDPKHVKIEENRTLKLVKPVVARDEELALSSPEFE
jgi:hypothetical protein